MAQNSKISWTDHTFNPWWGCVKVSPACDHCYAEGFDKRMFPIQIRQADGFAEDTVLAKHWGVEGERRFFGDKHWNEPLKWNKTALQEFGRPARVFCASMADVFEDRRELDKHRDRLFSLIQQTPNLLWNLLTKRNFEIKKYNPFLQQQPNVRIGVTVENQTYDHRIVEGVSWISAEPLLGALTLENFGVCKDYRDGAPEEVLRQLNWVIVGGESGAHAREMKLEWAVSLIEECKAAGVAVHFKQTGDVLARKLGLKDKSGKDPSEWPAELRIQEFPRVEAVPRD